MAWSYLSVTTQSQTSDGKHETIVLYSRGIFSCLCPLEEFTVFYSSRGRLPAVIPALSKHQRRTTLWAVPSVLSHLFLHQRVTLLWPLPSSSRSREEKIYQVGGGIRRYSRQQLAYLQEVTMNRSLVETYRCHFVIHYKLSQALRVFSREKPPSYGE